IVKRSANTLITTTLAEVHKVILDHSEDANHNITIIYYRSIGISCDVGAFYNFNTFLISDFNKLTGKKISIAQMKNMNITKAAEYYGENYNRVIIIKSDENFNSINTCYKQSKAVETSNSLVKLLIEKFQIGTHTDMFVCEQIFELLSQNKQTSSAYRLFI